jgi:hypothetical protein
MKGRWKILRYAPEFSLATQAQIPAALCAIHNFIREVDPGEITQYANITVDPEPFRGSQGSLASSVVGRAEREQSLKIRDKVAKDMWAKYQEYLHRQAMH